MEHSATRIVNPASEFRGDTKKTPFEDSVTKQHTGLRESRGGGILKTNFDEI
jgi:hypothetical protein